MKRNISVFVMSALLLANILQGVLLAPPPPADAKTGSDFRIPLYVEESQGLARTNQPVTSGIPLAQGWFFHVNDLRLVDSNNVAVPAQFRTTATYPDGSLRWVLVDFQTSVNAKATNTYYVVENSSTPMPQPTSAVQFSENNGVYTINTGPTTFRINKNSQNILEQVTSNGEALLSTNSFQGVVITDASGKQFFTNGTQSTVTVIEKGPMKVGLKISGKHRASDSQELLDYTFYWYFYAGQPTLQGLYRIENHLPTSRFSKDGQSNYWDLGGSGSRYIEDASFVLHLARNAKEAAVVGEQSQGIIFSSLITSPNIKLYQDSSGGENWQSPNHMNKDGQVKTSFQGYKVYTGNNVVSSGKRALGFLDAKTLTANVSIGMKDFWQNFPGALEATTSGKVTTSFFPKDFNDVYELQGGEFKTHEFYVRFDTANKTAQQSFDTFQTFQNPLFARVDDDYYLASGAFYENGKYDPNTLQGYEGSLEASVILAPKGEVRTLVTQREVIDEYGWRNFGEVMPDHEEVCGSQSYENPIGHYNNQYDAFFGAFTQYARTGKQEYINFGSQGIRHMVDIDVYHVPAGADNGAAEGGMFPHTNPNNNAETATHRMWSTKQNCSGGSNGGNPDPWHNYMDGAFTYYYLTGYEPALETGLESADYMVRRTDMNFGTDPRALSNGIRTLDDAYRATGNEKYFNSAKTLVERAYSIKDNFNGTDEQWMEAMMIKSVAQFAIICQERGNTQDPIYAKSQEMILVFADKTTQNYTAWSSIQGLRYMDTLMYAYNIQPKQEYMNKAAVIFDAFQTKYWAIGEYSHAKEESIALTNGGMYIAKIQPGDLSNTTPVKKVPVVYVTPSVTEGLSPLKVKFTATATDSDGTVTNYEWDLDGDTVFELSGAAMTTAEAIYTTLGSHTVAVRVTDNDGLQSRSSVTVKVTSSQNMPPIIQIFDTVSGNEIKDPYLLKVKVSDVVKLKVKVTDPEGLCVSYMAAPLPQGATDKPSTTELYTHYLQWTVSQGDVGHTNAIHFYSTDCGEPLASTELSLNVEVSKMEVNQKPVFDPTTAQTVSENSSLSFAVKATDADNDVLTYSAQNLPSGASFTKDSTGTYNFSWTPTYDQAGSYPVSFFVSDGKETVTQDVVVNVSNVNRAPVVESLANRAVSETKLVSFPVKASDPDGDALSMSVDPLPRGAKFTYDTTQKNYVFSWTPDKTQSGKYPIKFIATDGAASSYQATTITVTDFNHAPVITDPKQKVFKTYVGDMLSIAVKAKDVDGDTLKISAQGKPFSKGAKWKNNTFTWKTKIRNIGKYTVTFSAYDGKAVTQKQVTIIVLPKILKR